MAPRPDTLPDILNRILLTSSRRSDVTSNILTNFLNVYHQNHHDDYLHNFNISVSESFRTLNVKNNRSKKKDNSEVKIFLSDLSVKN